MGFIILFALLLLKSTSALIGYDCGSRSLNVTTVSLLEVAPCEIPQSTINVTLKYIQLLQINDFVETKAIQCKLEIHRTIYHCGMFSHTSVVEQGESEYISEISYRKCLGLVEIGVINIGNNHVISGVKVNQTTSYPVVFAGFINSAGRCNGGAYTDPYGSWESVVVQGIIRITVQEQMIKVDVNNNKVHLKSGTICTLSDTSCIDTEGGYTFWKPVPADVCSFFQYSILYEGEANKLTDTVYNKEQTVYSLSTEDITFALATKNRESVCGYVLIRTEHPKLLIFETAKGDSFPSWKKISISNLDIFAYVNSKFVYIEKHVKSQIRQLYRDVLMHRCHIERETLKNALAIATQAPDQFAYNLMKGPGYMAVTAGEVVHIIKCIPVEVQVEHGNECYAELQVTRRNTTHFLTPRTHILKSRGVRVNCNSILPSMYRIDEGWYKILPRPVEGRDPIVVKPESSPSWRYVSPQSLATSGIYTSKDLEELKNHIMFPIERAALLNDIAREMHGQPVEDKDRTIDRLLNENTLEKIAESTWGRIWGKFITFGSASAGIIAVFAVIQGIKMLIEIMVNGYLLHQLYGFSIHLIAAFWNTITQLLIQTNKRKKNHTRKEDSTTINIEEPVEENLPLNNQQRAANIAKEMNPSGFFSLGL